MTVAAKVDATVRAVCPIDGVHLGRVTEKLTWGASFRPEATPVQRTAAQGAMNSFDLAAAINPTLDDKAAEALDAVDRLQFDVLFNHENRIRALEGKLAITQGQFRDALIARWKVLNPSG